MKQRNYEIDFFRFVFAFLVMCSHANALFGWNQCKSGAIGVEFFFVVSGYFFSQALRQSANSQGPSDMGTIGSDSVRFIFHRIGTFYPYFIFSLILAFLVCQIVPGNSLMQVGMNGINSVWELLLVQAAGFGGYFPTGTAWYLSALMLSQWILYPFARKNYNLFSHWFAPLAAILLTGIISQVCINIYGTTELLYGFFSRGILRGVSEICIGCIAYEISLQMREWNLRRLARVLLTIVEIFGYGAMVLKGWFAVISQLDYILLLLIGISITITMSGQGLLGSLFKGRLPLGKFSLALYLNHFYWAQAINVWVPNWSVANKLYLFFTISFASAALCLIIVDQIRKRFDFTVLKKRLLLSNIPE